MSNNDKTPTSNEVAKQQVVAYTQKSQIKHETRHIQLVREYGFHPRNKATVEDGDVLPKKFEPFPENMYGRPLEEIDHFIYEETFCVVSKRFRKNYIHRFTGTKSLFLFHPWSVARRICVYIATNQFFDYCVMATILFNCIFLAMTETVEEAEFVFLAIYTIEMVIKIIAKGFLLNKYTYLRNPWNWLDFVVIASGYATIGMDVGNLAGLRTFRVLRALKTVSIMPGLKTIINALLHSFRQLAEVMTLTIFCLMVFALFALQVYMGELRNKCVKNLPEDWINTTDLEWKLWINDTDNWLYDDEELPLLCGNLTGARHCPFGYTCLCVGENPNHGYTNFDNFMWSMLTTFQLITLDYWENVYNMVLATSGPMSVSFFTVVVFFGSFYLINLMLAVVALSYEEEAEITNEERKKDLMDHRDDSTFSFDPSVLNVKKLNKNNKNKIDSRKGVLASYNKKKVRRKKVKGGGKGECSGNNTDSNGNGTHTGKGDSLTPTPSPSPRHSGCERPTDLDLKGGQHPKSSSVKDKQQRQTRICFQEQDTELNPNMLYPSGQLVHAGRQGSSSSGGGGVNRESSQDDSGVVDDHEEQDITASEVVNVTATNTTTAALVDECGGNNEHTAVTLALSPREVRLIKCNGNIARIKKHNIYALHPEDSSEIVVIDDLPDRNCDRCVQCCIDYEGWLQFQNCLYKVVRDPLFELAITLCIVLNTAFLAMEHHGMSESFRNALDVGNKVFTSIFTFECIIKLMALSKEFFLCGWNIFDLIIVTASLLDIIFELVDGLSVLRGLRLLRVLKLAQSWTTMKVLLSIIISTIGALGNLTLILVIVIYIFAVIGMQLFSKDYTPEKFEPDPVPRWNFNDFFHSFMMIFRILCGEWIEPLWDCMRAEEEQGASTCFAIFLPTLVMGNFMVLNLFLALLLNSFNSEELKSKKEEVGEESKLARSIERVRDLIRKKRQERKERKERKYASKFQQIVIEAQNAAASSMLDKPGLMSETKFHRLSYQESMNRPISGSDFGIIIPLKGSLHTIIDNAETEEDRKSYTSSQQYLHQQHQQQLQHQHQQQQQHDHSTSSPMLTTNQPALQLLYQQQQTAMPSFDGTVASSCQLDNNSPNPQADRRLQHQMSSGFGTQPNDSRDDPTTYTESIELQMMGQYNSTDTDPYNQDQRSGSYMRGDSLQERISTRLCSEEHDESYLQYQKSLLTRSPSYRKSLDRLSQSSDQSQRSLIPSRRSEDENVSSMKRDLSGHSLNTISMEHEELLSNHVNLRDELLNCDQKELFQFLQEDALDNSNNYFSDTVGYGSTMEADTDSLIVMESKREERKPSTSSIKSNLSYISNSILQTIESRRNGGSHSSNGNGQDNESVPLVEHSEFDNIIQSFEKELEEIKKSTTSLERRLSTLSEPSPAADEANKAILEHIAVITGASERTAADEVVTPLNPYDSYDLSTVPRRQHSLPASTNRASVKIKRRSLEKQRKIDEDFCISNEIRKICDQIQAPFSSVEAMSIAATQASGAQSPFMRRKSDLFSAQFDRFKRMSLIERVDEVPEEDKPISTLRMESERLPRKCLTVDATDKIDSLSLKSTNSYENLLLHKQLTQLAQQQQQQQQHHDSSNSSSAVVPPTPPVSLKSSMEPPTLVQMSSLKATPPLTALTEHQQHYHATNAQLRTTPLLPRAVPSRASSVDSEQTQQQQQHQKRQQQRRLQVKSRSEHPQSALDKAASFQSARTESHSSGAADTSSALALAAGDVIVGQLQSAGGSQEKSGDALQSQKSAFSRLTEKPWHCLVSYVDDLTVGGRRNSQGAYNDPMTFPSFGHSKPPKVPDDCFPQKCYEHFYFRCPWFMSCMDTPTAKHWTRVRTAVLTVVDTPAFEWFVLVLIFASSITLCFEDIYLDSNKSLKRILYWTNFSFCLIFVVEMVLKWLALGFSKYFTSFWTILDFIIVFVSVFSLLIEENENLKVLRSLRTLRALRPLRAISRWQGMRIVVNALMYAIPSIFNVLLVCLVFWLIFSIMGVQFFGGKFFKCVDNDGELLPVTEVNDKWDCIEQNYSWINSKITFDHVGMGYLALLQVATFEGWMEVMADAVDARGVDLQPQREANLYAYIYFVIFIVCGSFFTLNLFIGVIIDNFNMLKKKYEGGVLEMFLTESQKHYYTAMKKLGRKKPQKVIKRPINHFLAMFYDLSNSRRFEIAIFVLIFLNMLTMGIEHYNQPHAVFFILEVSNAFFTTVFGLEAIVKIVGLRYHYFTVPWNVFDFLLVLASIFGILMEDIMIDLPISPTLLRVVRVFRIGRILRLIKAAKGIRKLLFALVVSLPALFNIGALLGLITFIYAILGMSLFGHVKLQGALDDMVNFQTFGRSMQLLFRLMTSAGWNDVLESLMIQPPDCDAHFNRQTNGDCGHPLLAITYFTSFIIISYMIVINMYIAIILENFNQAHQEEEIGIVEDDLEMFYIRWSKYDPHATQFIHFAQLSDFIASLDPPLGISKPNTVALVSFNLPISKGNKIHCLDILHALVKHVLGHVEETDNFKQLQEQMDVKFKKQFPTRKELEIVSSTRIWKRQEKAAKTIQNAWREYQRKKEKERSNSGDSATQTSSPGGWQARLSSLNFFHLQVSRRGTQCSSRASSRKSSRASDASDISELAGPWLNLPLMLVSGADDVVKDIKQQSDDMGKRGSIFVEAPRANRRRSFYNFFLRHQDAVDDSLTSPSVHRKSVSPTTAAISSTTSLATTLADNTTIASLDAKSSNLQQTVVTPTRKRATSFIRKKPPLERGLSAQSALRVNKNAFVSEGPTPEVIVTKPSPEQSSLPLGLRPENSTLVHVLVHRESEEYKEEEEEGGVQASPSMEKPKPPQIRISPGSDEVGLDLMPPSIVQIMIESPKEPPRGDFSTDFEMAQTTITPMSGNGAIVEPIDVNVQGDTSKVFYDYDPDEANEIVILETLAEESPKSEDIPMTALPDIPVPMTLPRDLGMGSTEAMMTTATTTTSSNSGASAATPTTLPYTTTTTTKDKGEEQEQETPVTPPQPHPFDVPSGHIPTSTSSSSTSSNEDSDKNR
ncbi:sodium channel protein 60E isoform X7 [Stomoxys calcitrans]|uniref:sodium channel protein 60E isoform X7 n=2 Tax=Stomoxys calcitrans TaxID=35570 RepID=UPI0027E31C95|nr:sodium channel protein 60E isoform X7 [Stomoxys calcitrans]